ncbi:MAG: glycoside hydrolase family 2 TIM barrel-domain containing protein [Bacteroidota bacterium]
MKQCWIFLLLFFCISLVHAQVFELNKDWLCANIKNVQPGGAIISKPSYKLTNWMPATVPGTVLTTMLNNKLVADPFYGMNNKYIPDIYNTGNEYYTYWFVNDFKATASKEEQVWLQLRGINYKCDLFLNGVKLNKETFEGMHLRQQYNITSYLNSNGNNRLAVIVYPPEIVGNPNGGQGGDGTIARGLTTQYTAGWDWIQPIRDRNTGIWDKVTIEKTRLVNLQHPHVVTIVPGKRLPEGKQAPATLNVSAEIVNPTAKAITGYLQYKLQGNTIRKIATIPAKTTTEIVLPELVIQNPKLWWPNGYGEQHLYKIALEFVSAEDKLFDKEIVSIGIRQLDNKWNNETKSMQAFVNGQPIFIKGGNWIISDAMLRFSEERYDAEIRFHRDMNLNLIRIWGGAITERPEFYNACDKYGLLVFQDFWFSGDCNGRWLDGMKKEDQWTRRKYPDNHPLVLTAAADQIKMIRNHPSLAYWCGGNEITPPDDILLPLRDSVLPKLDGTRYFFDFSNSDSMSLNTIGGNGDGPYSIQDISTFWHQKTFPYNSEVGSVGVGDYASLEKFIPKENMVAPQYKQRVDSVWNYHKYIGYDQYMDAYGKAKDVKDFAMKAQLLNYDQYRGLMEGFQSHMWEWYTGSIIWKTQNPWTALRGQMYDYYLDVNACLYGLRKGSEPLHIMMDPKDKMVMITNHGFTMQRNLMMEAKVYDVITGKDTLYSLMFNEIGPSMSKKYYAMNGFLKALKLHEGAFVSLRLLKEDNSLISDNFYWLPGDEGQYTALQKMPETHLTISASEKNKGKIEVILFNDKNHPVAFFNRIALVDESTGERILPGFFSDNYISVLPGETKTISIEYPASKSRINKLVEVYGWNVPRQLVDIR